MRHYKRYCWPTLVTAYGIFLQILYMFNHRLA